MPGLASSLRNINALTWELKLRTGVKFHNGEPFNAEAVKFTIDRVLDPATKSVTRGNFTWIKEVKIIDENTVQIITAKPFPAAPEFLTLGLHRSAEVSEVGRRRGVLAKAGGRRARISSSSGRRRST